MIVENLVNQHKKFKSKYSYDVKNMIFTSSCRSIAAKVFLYSLLLLIAVIVTLIPQIIISNSIHDIFDNETVIRHPTDMKYVLLWSPTYPKIDKEYVTGQSLFIKQNCPFVNCFLTYNKTFLKKEELFDAVVFDVKDVNNLKLHELDLARSSKQKYVFKSLVSSDKMPICNEMTDNFFNWTWTYKLNSDIPHPYFNIFDRNNRLIGPRRIVEWTLMIDHDSHFEEIIYNKSKAIAWIVKDCRVNPKHLNFIYEFKSELAGYGHQIDIYGPCERKCSEGSIEECYKMIEKDYFFILAFEDAYIHDYITEDVVKIMNYIILPLVWSGAAYNSFLPPGSYINVNEFDMKKLGSIVNYLITNPSTYQYFFDWKKYYYYTPRPRNYVCDLCTKLNHRNSKHKHKTYQKFRQWWNPNYKTRCNKKILSAEGLDGIMSRLNKLP